MMLAPERDSNASVDLQPEQKIEAAAVL